MVRIGHEPLQIACTQSHGPNDCLKGTTVCPPQDRNSEILEVGVLPVVIEHLVWDKLVVVQHIMHHCMKVFIGDWGIKIVYPVDLFVKSLDKLKDFLRGDKGCGD